jgi:hypothetical protein
MRHFLPIIVLVTLFSISCEKKNTVLEEGIHFYLLSDHETLDPLWEIEKNAFIPEEDPIISYVDILSYNLKSHTFKISDSARERLQGVESDIHGRPFVLVAHKQFIYTGYFWASYSSAICPWLTIDPIHAQYSGELRVALGYPWLMDDMSIPDSRNDERLLNILRQDRKLID